MKLFILSLFLGFALAAHAQDTVFIAHLESSDKAITTEDAKSILLGSLTKWRTGPVIKLIVLTDGPVHEHVIKHYTQRTPDQFDKFWKKLIFTGNGIMPAQAKTDAEVVAFVAATPGACGYVAKGSATSAVKVLSPQ